MATVYREVWTNEVVKAIVAGVMDTFLDGIPDKSRYVTGSDEAQIIHSTFFGVEPDVLINNNTYPLAIQTLDGEDFTVVLDKYQTKATPITDDELYALSYDKIAVVKDSHSMAIIKRRLMKAIHALAPVGNAAATPVVLTTGNNSADGTRKMLTWQDLVNFRNSCTTAGIDPNTVRVVLCPDHASDLMIADLSSWKAMTELKSGSIVSQLGYDIRQYALNPYYNPTTKAKLAFGGVPTSDHRMATVAFVPGMASKATGLTKMYYSEAKTDPLNQQNLINFRSFFVALPVKAANIGAIVSAIPA